MLFILGNNIISFICTSSYTTGEEIWVLPEYCLRVLVNGNPLALNSTTSEPPLQEKDNLESQEITITVKPV